MKNNSALGTTGYKVAAYINLFSFTPFALFYLTYLLFGTRVNYLLGFSMRLSVLGPWMLNFYAIYVLIKTGLSSSSVIQYVGLVAYLAYAVLQMVIQVNLFPAITTFLTGEVAYKENFYRDYVAPAQDIKAPPNMEDFSYLDSAQEESGPWPTDEERDRIFERIQEEIDNDPRPTTAEEYNLSLWKNLFTNFSESHFSLTKHQL